MTVQTTRDVADIVPITFATDAEQVAVATYGALLDLLDGLAPEDWAAQTECPAWTVSDMVGHLIGAARANASLRELLRQQLWAMRHKDAFDGNDLDAMNALQVRTNADLTPEQRVEALRDAAPAAVRGRMRFPRPLRGIRVPVAPSGSTAEGMPRSLSMGHLMGVIYTRDAWLHRVDIARATGRDLVLDPALDGRIVEDVVAEWAARHRQPFTLTLTGPAGGMYVQGSGGAVLALDAVEFCRVVSGRAPGEGLLATRVLF
jgi:uncharacterized protein (TIGR03083 family)